MYVQPVVVHDEVFNFPFISFGWLFLQRSTQASFVAVLMWLGVVVFDSGQMAKMYVQSRPETSWVILMQSLYLAERVPDCVNEFKAAHSCAADSPGQCVEGTLETFFSFYGLWSWLTSLIWCKKNAVITIIITSKSLNFFVGKVPKSGVIDTLTQC